MMHFRALPAALFALLAASGFAATDNIANSTPPTVGGFVTSVTADAAGNSYVCGYYISTLDFNPGFGADERIANGLDAFVSCYSASGAYKWTQTFSGSGSEFACDLTVLNGVVYAVGFFDSVDAFLGASGPAPSPGGGNFNTDAFVVALDAATGAPVLSFGNAGIQVLGGTGSDQALCVAAAGSTVYVGGDFDSLDFGIGGAGSIASASSLDGFIAALDATTGSAVASFALSGVQLATGSDEESVKALTVSGGYLYAAGQTFSSDTTIGGIGSLPSNAVGYGNAFVAKLDAATGALSTSFNSPKGGVVFGGTGGDDQALGVRVANGNVYVSGVFSSPDAGIGALGSYASVTAGFEDGFVLALADSNGLPLSAFGVNGLLQFGGSGNDSCSRLDVLGSTVYAAGTFDSADAGFGALGSIAGPGGGNIEQEDAFVLALDGATGARVASFSGDGVQTFGGTGSETGDGIVALPGRILVAGLSASIDAGVGALGTISTAPFFGYVLPLDLTGTFTPPPPVGGGSGANVSDGKPPVVNPLTGVAMKVLRSSGGYVLLQVDISSLNRAALSASTDFEDIPGRGSSGVAGGNPSHVFTQAGVFVATSHAIESGTNAEKGKMRKTLALSSRETGGSGALPPPADSSIGVTKMKGKFLFSKSTPDQVSFTGTITLPAGFVPANPDGNELSIGVGNITDTVLIDAKGRGKLPSEKGRITRIKVKYPRLPKGSTAAVGGETASVSLIYKTADMDLSGFDTEGITTTLAAGEDGAKGVARNIQVAMVLNGVAYESIAPVTFKLSKKGDAGTLSRTSKR